MWAFDSYRKPIGEFKIKTATGGLLSAVSIIIGLYLFVSELRSYLMVEITDSLSVLSRGYLNESYKVSLEMDLYNVPCEDVRLRVIDEVESRLVHQINVVGGFIISDGKGCRLKESMRLPVSKVLIFISGRKESNYSHKISNLSLGDPYPVQLSPLESREFVQKKTEHRRIYSGVRITYQLSAIETIYSPLGSNLHSAIRSFQYSSLPPLQTSLASLEAGADFEGESGIMFSVSPTPFFVSKSERSVPLSIFLVRVCASIGGIHSLLRMIDLILFRLSRSSINKGMSIPDFISQPGESHKVENILKVFTTILTSPLLLGYYFFKHFSSFFQRALNRVIASKNKLIESRNLITDEDLEASNIFKGTKDPKGKKMTGYESEEKTDDEEENINSKESKTKYSYNIFPTLPKPNMDSLRKEKQ